MGSIPHPKRLKKFGTLLAGNREYLIKKRNLREALSSTRGLKGQRHRGTKFLWP
jgi:hypothetical protein